MKSTLEKRLLIFSFLILTITITVNTGFNIENFRRHYRDGIILRVGSLAGGLKSSIEAALERGAELPLQQDLHGRCQEIVATDPEIAYCLIENSLGQPLFSHDPSFHFAAGTHFVSPLDDAVTLLDLPSAGRAFDVSQPFYAPGGELAGRVRIGFPEAVLRERTERMLHQSLLVLGAAFVVVFGLVAFFLKRDVVGPIRRLCAVAREIAGGNLRISVPPMPTRDFAELGTALQEMARSLQMRDDAVLQGYQELEQTNLLLQQSYEQQEHTSTELARSQKMYLALFENASDAIVISDQDDRVILFNRRAEEFSGISRDRVIGQNLFHAVEMAQGDSQVHYQLYQELLEKGRKEWEFNYVRASDGERRVGAVSASVTRERNGKLWMQAIIRDVTRERQIKENLEKSARELERLNQMKDSFLGLASHELKTPLTVIVGYADLILNELEERLDGTTLAMVRNIAEAADRLTAIVRDMVDVSMLDSRRLPLDVRRTDVNRLVRQAVDEHASSFSVRRQQVDLQLQNGLPPIDCDPDRLKQALGHLLGNAIKFTPDRGRISVETRIFAPIVRPHPVDRVERVEVVIRDTGIGIAEGDCAHIFDKFYEGGMIEEHFTGKVAFKGKGAGLGLTIAKGIIDLHGGRIWVESPGHDPEHCPGSTFHLLLPVSTALPAPS